MNIASGTRLGPYEIVARLGAGGMGEVWSATDTRLERKVAVKILPPELAHDAQFKLRFEREARTISQLSHPNICTLFDVGDGFLVMELLEGETLADRIARGPMPMGDVLRYGVQIAEALAKAHRSGIVHRDLKPANVMITKSGAKLLDFGLAKLSASVVNVDDATRQKALTQEGTILGTFQYMAPEQLEGQEADARTDIFALGALLYEMATGRRAFEGKTRTSLIAQIVGADPKPLRETVPLTPPAFEHVVARCLSKDPDERWQSAQDIAEHLRWTAAAGASIAEPRGRRASMLPWAVAAAILVAALTTIAIILQRAPASRVTWADIAPPKDVWLLNPNERRGGSAIAPDGQRIAFVARDQQNVARIYVRDLSSGDVRAIASTERASFPFWSADSRSVAFFSDGKLKRIDVDGTRAAVVAADVDGRGGTWAADGTILFATSSTSGLSRVRASGGPVEMIIPLGGDQVSLRFPSMLPDGKHFLYVGQGDRDGGLYISSLDERKGKKLLDLASSAVFVAGSVVFLRDGALFAQQIDLGTLQLRGEPRQIASGVSGSQHPFGNSGLSASADGDILFFNEFAEKITPVWRDRAGTVLLSLPIEVNLREPALSPDEKRAVASSYVHGDALMDLDLQRGRIRKLSLADVSATSPVWSRDGKRIVALSASGGRPVIASMPPSGGKLEILTALPQVLYPETYSPDGTFVVLGGPAPGGKHSDLWTLHLADRKVRPLLSTPSNEGRLQFSPDGRFIAHTSDETGRPEIFVQTWPLSDGKWQVTTAGGDQAFWISDGKELVYLAPDGKLMSVAVPADPSTQPFGDPVVLFQTPLAPVSMTGLRNQYVATRDGQRFLLFESSNTDPSHLKLIQGFARLVAD